MKKALKYILYTLLVIVILFFGLGLLKPELEYGHEVVVNKPIKEAWAVAHDQSKFSQWLAGFKSTELISGEQGQVGAKSKIVVQPEGEEPFEMIETIESIKEYDHITMHFDNEMMTFDQTMRFKEVDGKTNVSTESTVAGKGIFMRSMFAFMELFGSFQKQEEKNINALQKVIEDNTTDYYPAPPAEEEVEEVN